MFKYLQDPPRQGNAGHTSVLLPDTTAATVCNMPDNPVHLCYWDNGYSVSRLGVRLVVFGALRRTTLASAFTIRRQLDPREFASTIQHHLHFLIQGLLPGFGRPSSETTAKVDDISVS